jgi:hypothetical protein
MRRQPLLRASGASGARDVSRRRVTFFRSVGLRNVILITLSGKKSVQSRKHRTRG